MNQPSRILFCDYDGEFNFSESLSKAGFLVDEIRPDGLRQVSVGDHQLYLFCFSQDDNMRKAFKTCDKLKSAELPTPLMLLYLGKPGPEFFNHKQCRHPADTYLAHPNSEDAVLDSIDSLIGCPIPATLKGSFQIPSDDRDTRRAIEKYQRQIMNLEERIRDLESESTKTAESLDKALEAQRNFYKPKLKALLEGQKIQLQTETERLKFQLSEVEAKLLARELKIKELEAAKAALAAKADELQDSHKKAQKALREFYQAKLKTLEIKLRPHHEQDPEETTQIIEQKESSENKS